MSRLEFNRATRRAVIERAAGCCEGCGAVLKTGGGEIDHILPDALGGKPEVANARLLCRPCHVSKTAEDIRRIRKADRQRDKHTGAFPPSKVKLQSRGFAVAEKQSAIKPLSKTLPRRHIMSGEVL